MRRRLVHTIVRERQRGPVLITASVAATLRAWPGSLTLIELAYLVNCQLPPDERLSVGAIAAALGRLERRRKAA